jgi:Glycosyl transferase family 2
VRCGIGLLARLADAPRRPLRAVTVALLAQVHAARDILRAWLEHYRALGVAEFHLVLHGSPEQARLMDELRGEYPIRIRGSYGGLFSERDKMERLRALLPEFRGRWIFVVDDDEFVELPRHSLPDTLRRLERFGATAMAAPMLQRMRADGSLESPDVVPDPFREFPLCSLDLHRLMGTRAVTDKYPLMLCGDSTTITGGSHSPGNGPRSAGSPLRGVTHHFKWRHEILGRLRTFVESKPVYHYWHESETYLSYLQNHNFRLPLNGAFPYSRRALLARGLLDPGTFRSALRRGARRGGAFARRVARAAKRRILPT